jgi:PhnB protein
MARKVSPIPEGYHTVTPQLTIRGASAAIEFYKKAFRAVEQGRMMTPDGKSVLHAELRIGDSIIMVNDEFPEMGGKSPMALDGTPVTMHLYVEDADAVFRQALAAGASQRMPLENSFWGDRYGMVTDPFGHGWSIATRIEIVPPEEMPRRMQAAMQARAASK